MYVRYMNGQLLAHIFEQTHFRVHVPVPELVAAKLVLAILATAVIKEKSGERKE